MNIMCLPFALVVSVIAATAVFRNVFTAYDSFSSEGVKHSGGSSGPMGLGGHGGAHPNSGSGGGSGAGGKGLRTGARILFNHNTSTYAGGATTADVTSIPLGDYKGGYSVDSETGDVKSGYGGVGAISVTKVVDVEVDGGRDQTVRFCFYFILWGCGCCADGVVFAEHLDAGEEAMNGDLNKKTISTWVFFVLLVRIRQLGF